MLKLKLIKGGKKHNPKYKIGLMKANTKLNGVIIQNIGYYNPKTKDFKLKINYIINTLKNGAQPTSTIKSILLKTKIIFINN